MIHTLKALGGMVVAPHHLAAQAGRDVLRDGGNGLFLSASTYPKVRETRNPTVEDLQRHRAALPEKYLYLADAPAKDPKGRPAIVRFARKEREHYIASENAEGKPSGWSARFVDGAWKAE